MSTPTLPVAKPIGDTTYTYTVSDESVESLLSESSTAMVYGFQHCKYVQVTEALEQHRDVSRIYDCSLGNDYDAMDNDKQKRLDGRSIHKISSGIAELDRLGKKFETQDCNRKCKTGLVNQVLENYRKATLEDREISPIIFCIDYENETTGETNPHPLTSENMLSKTKIVRVSRAFTLSMNRIITHSELRRAYKLCHDPRLDPEIRAIANRTFKFVKVNETREEFGIDRGHQIDRDIRVNYNLEQIEAPWEKPDFDVELRKRKARSSEQTESRCKVCKNGSSLNSTIFWS